jgi:PKD repeat protein
VNGIDVSVDASASRDPDGSIQSYSWNWGYASTNGFGVTTSHTYPQSGQYFIALTVTDNKGATATISLPVTVIKPNVPPTA